MLIRSLQLTFGITLSEHTNQKCVSASGSLVGWLPVYWCTVCFFPFPSLDQRFFFFLIVSMHRAWLWMNKLYILDCWLLST